MGGYLVPLSFESSISNKTDQNKRGTMLLYLQLIP